MDGGERLVNDPLVIIPGLLADARVVLPQMLAVGEKMGVTVSLPVQGHSVEPMAEAVLHACPPRFALMGMGLGGAVALEVMRRAADRITRVIFVATDPLPEDPKVAAEREVRMVAVRAGRMGEMLLADVCVGTGPDAEFAMDVQRDMAFDLGEGVYLRQSRALQRRPDQQKTLRKAAMPALLIAGAEDRIVSPRRMEFMESLMPHARLVVIERVGSLPTLEAPDAVNEVITGFLGEPLFLR
jgi:pimeloyl-ACP methyl ester carboxylesterase